MDRSILPIVGQLPPDSAETIGRSSDGPLARFNGHAKITGPCGDTMEFWICVSGQLVVDVGVSTDGCSTSWAAGRMAAQLADGKSLTEAAEIEQIDILTALGGLPSASEHCALLASNTLKAAVEDYRSRD